MSYCKAHDSWDPIRRCYNFLHVFFFLQIPPETLFFLGRDAMLILTMLQDMGQQGPTRLYRVEGEKWWCRTATMAAIITYVVMATRGMYRSGALVSCRGGRYLLPPAICSTPCLVLSEPRFVELGIS